MSASTAEDRTIASANQGHPFMALGHNVQDKENSTCLRNDFLYFKEKKNWGKDEIWDDGWLTAAHFCLNAHTNL